MILKKIKEQLFKEYNMVEKEYADSTKNAELNKLYKSSAIELDGDNFNGYYYEKDSSGNYKFYKLRYPDMTEEEFDNFIRYNDHMYLKNINDKVNNINKIIRFWYVLTVVILVMTLTIVIIMKLL